MKLSNHDYQRIAHAIRNARPSDNTTLDYQMGGNGSRAYIAYQLSEWFDVENTRFDKDKFLKACAL